MSTPNGIVGTEYFVLATDRLPTHFSVAESELAKRAICSTTASSGGQSLRIVLKMLRHHPVSELVVIGQARSRALMHLLTQAEHAGINITYS